MEKENRLMTLVVNSLNRNPEIILIITFSFFITILKKIKIRIQQNQLCKKLISLKLH